jgi:hypothetical protein
MGFQGQYSSPSSNWTLDPVICSTVSGLLSNRGDLWPKASSGMLPEPNEKGNDNGHKARKAAQLRAMEMMKQKQEPFVKTLAPLETGARGTGDKMDDGEDSDLCIICRCDDADRENNEPLPLSHDNYSPFGFNHSSLERPSCILEETFCSKRT